MHIEHGPQVESPGDARFANSGRLLGSLARELIFRPYSPAYWTVLAASLFTCRPNAGSSPSAFRPLSEATAHSATQVSFAADALAETAGVEALRAAALHDTYGFEKRLALSMRWKSELDTSFASFTNALSVQIREAAARDGVAK